MIAQRVALVLAAFALLPGCATPPAAVPEPAPVPTPAIETATSAVYAMPLEREAAMIAALDAALKLRLGGLPLSDTYRRITGDGQPPRLLIDADRAFEVGSAQLKPVLLLPLAEAAAATRDSGGWVLHAIGRAPADADADLAERRAASVIAYLGTQGIAGGRLRAETRRGSARQIELHFAPIIAGHEARAWMPPARGDGPAH